MGKRINSAVWVESSKRWQIKVQKDGIRRTFNSSVPGRAGQRECNAKADKWLDENISGVTKVSDLYAQWLKEVKLTKGTGTYDNYNGFGNNHILPVIGNKKMDVLTEQDFQNIINIAFEKGLSYKTLTNIRGCMQTFLKYCRKCKATNLLLENIEISKKAPKGSKTALKSFETKKLINNIDYTNYWYLNAFKLFVLTGLRMGELIALEKTDYNGSTIKINKSVNKYGELTAGKTDNSKREFILQKSANVVIQNQLKQIEHLDTKYLFPNHFGECSSGHTIHHQWKRFCKNNGITPISVHELRHTFISQCKNVPLELLKQVVGHSSSMDTFKQYGHELDGEKEKAKKLIEKEFRQLKIGG